MRTKTLLLTAAAIVAGVVSVQAQSNVYSVNVVGYVNRAFPGGSFQLVANPLDNGTNNLDSAFGALPAKSQAQFWNGASFDSFTKGTTWPGGAPAVPPGVGLFVKAQSATNNTFVGQVAAPVGGSVTQSLSAGLFVLVGSKVPYAGDLNDTNLALTQLAAKSQVQKWNGVGFDSYTKGTSWPVNPGLSVAEGFFLKSQTATQWVQSLPAN
jgi:hypothetical protein